MKYFHVSEGPTYFFFTFWRIQVLFIPQLVQVSVKVLGSTFISPQVQVMILCYQMLFVNPLAKSLLPVNYDVITGCPISFLHPFFLSR